MARVIAHLGSLIYLLTVPAGAYVYLSQETGYPTKAGGALIGILALIGIVLVVIAVRAENGRMSPTNQEPQDASNDKSGARDRG